MDLAISNWFYNLLTKSKFLAVLSKIITIFGEWWMICLLVGGLLIFKKTRKLGIYAGVACLFGFLCNNLLLKNLIQRARPFDSHPKFLEVCKVAGYALPSGYSMASGHATATTAFSVSLILTLKSKWKYLLIIFPVLVGVSRVALCVHYATDVLVGWALGVAFAGLSVLLTYFKINKNKIKKIEEK